MAPETNTAVNVLILNLPPVSGCDGPKPSILEVLGVIVEQIGCNPKFLFDGAVLVDTIARLTLPSLEIVNLPAVSVGNMFVISNKVPSVVEANVLTIAVDVRTLPKRKSAFVLCETYLLVAEI